MYNYFKDSESAITVHLQLFYVPYSESAITVHLQLFYVPYSESVISCTYTTHSRHYHP